MTDNLRHDANPGADGLQTIHISGQYNTLLTTPDKHDALANALKEPVAAETPAPTRDHDLLRRLLAKLILTEQRERRRIASNLHDHLAQLLVACKMKLSLLHDHVDPARQSAQPSHDPVAMLREIDGFLDESLAYTRDLVTQISPVLLYEQGFGPALRWLAEVVMPRHGLTVALDEPNELDETRIDEDMRIILFASVRELLLNVAQHADTAEAQLAMHTDDRWLEATVTDEGQGFDTEQTRGSADEASQGFGLLGIHELTSLLGGQFELVSTPGVGTRVSVRIPLAPISSEPTDDGDAPLTRATPIAERVTEADEIHVLVVDDHAVVREGLMMMLRRESGITVVGEAEDGPTALEQIGHLHPHVVLMDVGLPGIDGIETTRRITASHDAVQIIGLSMHEDESIANAMREAGAVDYLCKGCSSDLLMDAIHRAAGASGLKRTASDSKISRLCSPSQA